MRNVQELLTALESRGGQPAFAWYGEAARVELSGHVLAGWVIKAIGHLDLEIGLQPGDLVVLDMVPHWKRWVLALAAWGLGAEVVIADALGSQQQATLLVTDRPAQPSVEADEVFAVEPVSLALRFDGELPALVHDWVQEVRSAPDQLQVAVPDWAGPAPTCASAEASDGSPASVVSTDGDGLEHTADLLAVLLSGGRIVAGASGLSAEQRRRESLV